jgi:hypothetical protein
MDDDVEFHGPCPHCKRDLWLVLEDNVPAESVTKVHGFELPDGLGWFALGLPGVRLGDRRREPVAELSPI